MCLLVKKNWTVETAKEDLVFYKVAIAIDNNRGKTSCMSYFMRYPIELGVTYTEPVSKFKVNSYRKNILSLNRIHFVDKGGFYMFTNLSDARAFFALRNGYDTKTEFGDYNPYGIVLKAIVPKGTQFIRGTCMNMESICAKSVRYEKF